MNAIGRLFPAPRPEPGFFCYLRSFFSSTCSYSTTCKQHAPSSPSSADRLHNPLWQRHLCVSPAELTKPSDRARLPAKASLPAILSAVALAKVEVSTTVGAKEGLRHRKIRQPKNFIQFPRTLPAASGCARGWARFWRSRAGVVAGRCARRVLESAPAHEPAVLV